MEKQLPSEVMERIVRYQRDEVTGHALYAWIAKQVKREEDRTVLERIASDEKEHAAVWKGYTGRDVKPNRLKILMYKVLTVLLGYTFAIKLMEKGEQFGISDYERMADVIPEARAIIEDEETHEDLLLAMLDEERLQYVGDMILGLNDALVELTGTLAGLTFSLQNTRLVALSGIITGVSATLSMAASNYLAKRADGNANALKSSLYTGIAYIVTVALMVLPYFLFPSDLYVLAFVTMLVVVVVIIALFNYYISVAKSTPFLRRFGEMVVISLGVAVVAFVIGLLAKVLLGIDAG